MKKIWNGWLKESVFIFSVIYTLVTILNSILYLLQGYREDPSGNWHELTRAVIVLIGITAYEAAKNIKIRNIFIRAVAIYIPTLFMAFGAVYLNGFIEPLADSAYKDIFINYTGLFLLITVIAGIRGLIKRTNNSDN